MHFADLHLNATLLAAVQAEGYVTPTVIQQKSIPHVLDGRDLIGLAQTGTGKTAAFALPIIQRLMLHPVHGHRHIRVLVLAPTRELASQIAQSFSTYGRGAHLRNTVVFGGVGQGRQAEALGAGVDVLVATPGRLLDLHGQRLIDFGHLEVFVLDEADRMLDMGFIHDVKRIVKLLPTKRQTLFFSATMPPEVTSLANSLLRDPVRVEAHPVSSTADRIEQSVYLVERSRKRALLEQLLRDSQVRRALVFTRTKQGANKVVQFLGGVGVQAEAIHGNKSQGARERALANFISGATRVLVATDIAARGIDVEDISHIINFDLPNIPETYVHRIGRTARAGASGVALSFCDSEERPWLADIERLIGRTIPRAEAVGVPLAAEPAIPDQRPARPPPPPPAPRSPREARHRARSKSRRGPSGQAPRGHSTSPHSPPKDPRSQPRDPRSQPRDPRRHPRPHPPRDKP